MAQKPKPASNYLPPEIVPLGIVILRRQAEDLLFGSVLLEFLVREFNEGGPVRRVGMAVLVLPEATSPESSSVPISGNLVVPSPFAPSKSHAGLAAAAAMNMPCASCQRPRER